MKHSETITPPTPRAATADPVVISICNPKGGVGKSTLAMVLAHSPAFRKRFRRVGLVDMDPQGSLAAIHGQRPDGDRVVFRHVLSKSPAPEFRDLAEGVGAIVVDVPGESTGGFATRFALAAADLVVVPCRPSEMDINAVNENLWPSLFALKGEGIPAVVVPVFTHPATRPEKTANYMAEWFPEGVDVLPLAFPTRALYQTFTEGGATLGEFVSTQRSQRAQATAARVTRETEAIAKEIIRRCP